MIIRTAAAAVIAMAVLAAAYKIHGMSAEPSATAVISLRYQNASSGLAPDGTFFDMYEAVSDDVMETAAEELGEDPEKIQGSISIRPSGASAGQTVSSDYIMSYRGENGKKVLEAVCSAYETYFRKKHLLTADSVEYEACSFGKGSDPMAYAEYLENEADRFIGFLDTRIKEDDGWKPDEGPSLQTLKGGLDTVKDTEIAQLKTLIENSTAGSGEAASMKYTISVLEDQKKRADSSYEVRREAITLYDSKLFPTVSVPSVTSKDGEYYISTTKTGLDDIYEAAKYFLDASTSIRKDISARKIVLSKRQEAKSSNEDRIEEKVQDIEQDLKEAAEKIRTADAEFLKDHAGKLMEASIET